MSLRGSQSEATYGLCSGGGFWGSVGSFFSSLWSGVKNVVNWIGGLFNGSSSDQPAQPDSSPNASAATNSGENNGGFVPYARGKDGTYLVKVIDPDKFNKAVEKYKEKHGGENPVIRGWKDWNEFFKSGWTLKPGPNFKFPERYIIDYNNDMTVLCYGGEKSGIKARVLGDGSKAKIEMLADAYTAPS